MTEKEFLELLEEVIEAEPGTLSMDKWVVDIGGWNSIAIMSFIAMVDEKYEVILSPEEIGNAETIADLYKLLCDNISK